MTVAGQPHGSKLGKASLLVAGTILAAANSSWHRGSGFVSAPPPAGHLAAVARAGVAPAAAAAASETPGSSGWSSAWKLAGGLGALAAARLALRGGRPSASAQLTPAKLTSALSKLEEAEVPQIVMMSDGGRRKRLGVGGPVCMLTGRKKFKGFRRTFSEKKNIRYWRPNTHWKRLWWEREKKWVRLYVSSRAIRLVDTEGLERMARKAGLDLYAWSKPHWEPGSRQPLCLKVGYTAQARKDKKLWPDYLPKLNKGCALSEISSAPKYERRNKPLPFAGWQPSGTPPPALKVTVTAEDAS